MFTTDRKRTIIAFAGVKGSGKDTSADFIKVACSAENQRSMQFAYATILKNIVADTFDIDSDSEDLLKRNPNIKPFNGLNLRQIYQNFGENIKTYFGKLVWINITHDLLKGQIHTADADIILCTDLRYGYEQTALKKFAEDNGYDLHVIKVENLNLPKSTDTHISEQVDNIFEDVLIQASDLNELSSKILDFYYNKVRNNNE